MKTTFGWFHWWSLITGNFDIENKKFRYYKLGSEESICICINFEQF